MMQTTESESRNTLTIKSVDVLTQTLADENVLLMKLRKYEWNVAGPYFGHLRALFEEQYGILEPRAGHVAKRIRALGSPAPATMAEYLERTTLREHPGSFPPARRMLHELLGDHEAIIRSITASLTPPQNVLDVGTTDLLTHLLQEHENMAWILRANLSDNHEEQDRTSVLYE